MPLCGGHGHLLLFVSHKKPTETRIHDVTQAISLRRDVIFSEEGVCKGKKKPLVSHQV